MKSHPKNDHLKDMDKTSQYKEPRKPIDLVTIERLGIILRACHLSLDEKVLDLIIDAVELIEDTEGDPSLVQIMELKKTWEDHVWDS